MITAVFYQIFLCSCLLLWVFSCLTIMQLIVSYFLLLFFFFSIHGHLSKSFLYQKYFRRTNADLQRQQHLNFPLTSVEILIFSRMEIYPTTLSQYSSWQLPHSLRQGWERNFKPRGLLNKNSFLFYHAVLFSSLRIQVRIICTKILKNVNSSWKTWSAFIFLRLSFLVDCFSFILFCFPFVCYMTLI